MSRRRKQALRVTHRRPNTTVRHKVSVMTVMISCKIMKERCGGRSDDFDKLLDIRKLDDEVSDVGSRRVLRSLGSCRKSTALLL